MAGWTDYIPDWSSKDKLRLCSVYDALSALTTAVNERGSVLNSYTPLPTVNMLYPVKYYVDLIDSTIKSIVPQFVNHTISDGDFTGLEAIPMWTNGAVRGYGLRQDGTQKEMGFLGEIVSSEDAEMVFTEISVGLNINGTEMDVPSLVPTLTDEELLYMITEGYKEGAIIPESILEKASLYAQQRIAAGKSPFASDGEQGNTRSWITYRNSRLMPVIDWVWQRYQVVNKLRWTAPEAITAPYYPGRYELGKTVFSIPVGGGYSYIIPVNYTDWSNLISAFNSAELKDIGWWVDGHITYRVDTQFNAHGITLSQMFNTGQTRILYPQYLRKFILDSYVYPYGVDDSIFQPLPTVTLNNKLNKTLTFDEDYPSEYFYCLDFSEFSPEGKTQPPSIYNNSTRQFKGAPFMVLKFTGANGFQFKDW